MRKLIGVVGLIIVAVFCVSCGQKGEEGKPRLKAAFDHEYVERPEYERFGELYGFQFDNPELLDPALVYRAVNGEQVDVVDVFTSDGRIEAYDLRVLEDDQNLFPPYDACVLVQEDALEQYPDLREVLEKLSGRISPDEMQRMNYRYSEESADPEEVAHDFLDEEGLLEAEEGDQGDGADKPPVVIGSKHFGEQKILGHMLAELVETHTSYPVETSIGLQGTKVCFGALKNDEIDLYVEYTGTGLANILDEEYNPSESKNDVLDHVRDEFGERWNLTWLDPLGFDNSYALAMREKQAEELGIETISDLKPYVK